MKRLVKNAEGSTVILIAPPEILPPGFSEIAPEEMATEELALAIKEKLVNVRAKRDDMLAINDKLWLIASKKGESTTGLEADAETLRDLPELAETELEAMETVEDVQAYDCFAGLALNGDYE